MHIYIFKSGACMVHAVQCSAVHALHQSVPGRRPHTANLLINKAGTIHYANSQNKALFTISEKKVSKKKTNKDLSHKMQLLCVILLSSSSTLS